MLSLGPFDPVPLTLLDVDVAAAATTRSLVYHNAPGMISASIELHVTLLGATPVNLTVRVLGEDTAPATESTRLIPLTTAVVPDTSALVADYAGVFLIEAAQEYAQIEVQNVSGGNVHVKITASGSQTAAPKAASSTAGHVVVDSSALPTGASTAAKQPALGTAGTASSDVLTMQGIAGMTPVKVDVNVYAAFVLGIASADTSAHAISTSQAVKTPVFVKAEQTMTGTLTVTDGTHAGAVLAKGDAMPFHCTNVNQLTYQFSVNAATERFSISAGI